MKMHGMLSVKLDPFINKEYLNYVSRVSLKQMNAATPFQGAVVFSKMAFIAEEFWIYLIVLVQQWCRWHLVQTIEGRRSEYIHVDLCLKP